MDFNQRGRREVATRIPAAMRSVIRLFTTQPSPAKLILIKLFIRFEAHGFFLLAALSERRAIDRCRACPYASPPGACGADVVVHLPARAQTIAFIRRSNVF